MRHAIAFARPLNGANDRGMTRKLAAFLLVAWMVAAVGSAAGFLSVARRAIASAREPRKPDGAPTRAPVKPVPSFGDASEARSYVV